jgi:IS30 family transposase
MRTYKRKRIRNPDRRMIAVMRMREQGMSLRQIGGELSVSYMTVKRDLDRYQREHANVVPLSRFPAESHPAGGEVPHPDSAAKATPLSHLPVTNTPRRGQDVTPECDTRTGA